MQKCTQKKKEKKVHYCNWMTDDKIREKQIVIKGYFLHKKQMSPFPSNFISSFEKDNCNSNLKYKRIILCTNFLMKYPMSKRTITSSSMIRSNFCNDIAGMSQTSLALEGWQGKWWYTIL